MRSECALGSECVAASAPVRLSTVHALQRHHIASVRTNVDCPRRLEDSISREQGLAITFRLRLQAFMILCRLAYTREGGWQGGSWWDALDAAIRAARVDAVAAARERLDVPLVELDITQEAGHCP